MVSSGFSAHDHAICVDHALSTAQAMCAKGGQKLTPVRQRVLEILLESHAALGAYDILARLDAEGLGSKPPVVYRALGFWVAQGFAHRIERLNAFIACAHPGADHAPAFMICRACHMVAEAMASQTLHKTAHDFGFEIEQTVIEAEGLCPTCQDAA